MGGRNVGEQAGPDPPHTWGIEEIDMADADFVKVVREEVNELLEELESSLLELEESPEDMKIVGRAFRALHTVKGSAGMIGFDDIASFAHHVETALDKVRNGEIGLSCEFVNLVLQSKDHLTLLLQSACGEGEADAGQGEMIVDGLNTLVTESQGTGADAALQTETTDCCPGRPGNEHGVASSYYIHFLPSPACARQDRDLHEMSRCLGQLGELTILNRPETDGDEPIWDMLLSTNEELSAIREVFALYDNNPRLSIISLTMNCEEELPPHRKLGEILLERGDISPKKLQDVLSRRKLFGEVLVEENIVSRARVDSALAEQQLMTRKREICLKKTQTENIRVSAEKLDHQVNLVGELVVIQSRLSQLALQIQESELQQAVQMLERLSAEMRENVLAVRMLPIGTTFNRFRRLVRDLSGELGKEVELVTRGEETELDKSVIDKLGDPLIHLIRNSLDHGIESPEERRAAGKSARGTITLSASHSGANVAITVADDGKGLDGDRIREKAISRGIVAADADLDGERIFELIFAPGMSTAENVTNVSGRGVGMDVVKSTIEGKLKGAVAIASCRGEGTTVTITLPLTLAIIDGLLVQVSDASFVLPLAQVEKCVEISTEDVERFHDRHVFPFDDQLIPYVRLRDFFMVPGRRPDLEQMVVVQHNKHRFGLVLDSVVGSHQTVIKSLGWVYRNAQGLSGSTILGSGEVALIIDLGGIFQSALSEEQYACQR